MKFSICIGGLKYNISSLTRAFYDNHAKAFECDYSSDAYNIVVTQKELDDYSLSKEELNNYDNELVYILDKVIKHCLDFNRMIIHGAAIEYKNNGYLFVAPSKTGKSTHAMLWKRYLNEEVKIINGDKPMLEFEDEIIIHGTPWNGKENIGLNISVPLKGIVVLKQAKENQFRKLDINESIKALMLQSFYSIDKNYGPKVINNFGKIINKIPIYELKCDISYEAFKTCYNGLMNGGGNDEYKI